MVQKTISALVQDGISQSRYQLGDILREFDTNSNFLVVRVPDASKARYGLVGLWFPNELLWKRINSGIIVPEADFTPDLQHHPYSKVRPDIVDSAYKGRRIGHIDLSEEAITNSADRPILHAFPELRQFYDGSGHFQ